MDAKVEKINRVSFVILKHEIKKGHLKWKVAPLAKEAKVSRGWLYSYFGSDRRAILKNAIENTMDEFLFMSPSSLQFLKQNGLVAAFERTQKLVAEYPEVIIFSFKYVRSPCEFGEIVRRREADYAKKFLAARYDLKHEYQIAFLRSLINGIALSFFHSPQQIKILSKFMLEGNFIEWLKTQEVRDFTLEPQA